jgi:glucose-1-phosphate thymidylyltransferase
MIAKPKLKGVVLAGGSGSRLLPLTRVTNKHLLPVGRKPMIYWPIERLREAGVVEIMIVTGREHMGAIVGLLGSGADQGVEFTYRVQDEAGGIAQALGLARGFVGSDRCAVILGDNIFKASIRPFVERFLAQPEGARILLKRVPDASRFGVAELSADGTRVVGIQEKPAAPRSDLAVTGVYLYDARVFEVIATLKPSARGELEITDVNNDYIRRGMMWFDELPGEWTDAGTFESLLRANRTAADD